MPFDALEIAVQLVDALREPLKRLRTRDRRLAQQATDALNSIGLNLNEGGGRGGRDRVQCWHIADGSARELKAALRLAEAWGHLDAASLAPARALLDRELAMCWRLTRGPARR
jgi:four helix bundle protein